MFFLRKRKIPVPKPFPLSMTCHSIHCPPSAPFFLNPLPPSPGLLPSWHPPSFAVTRVGDQASTRKRKKERKEAPLAKEEWEERCSQASEPTWDEEEEEEERRNSFPSFLNGPPSGGDGGMGGRQEVGSF